MNHQPFDTWILSEEPLDESRENELKAHLEICTSCRDLSAAWLHVQETFEETAPPNPAPGFTTRWQTRLSVFRLQQQQRRMWLLAIGLFSLATMILILLAALNLLSTPWHLILGKGIATIGLAANRIRQVVNVLESLTASFPLLIPISFVFGFGILTAMLTLIVTWLLSVIKLYQPNNEGVSVR
jgi:predicted anti-sigma-YlaC factor YlaD